MGTESGKDELLIEADAGGRITGMNDAARLLLASEGLDEAEAAKVLPPDFPDLVRDSFEKRNRPVIARAAVGGSEILWVLVRPPRRKKVYAYGFRAATSEGLCCAERLETEILPAALTAAGHGIAIINADFVIEYQNKVLVEQFGVLRGRKCFEGCVGRESPCPGCPVLRAIETGEVQYAEFEYKNERTYGVEYFSFLDSDGRRKVLLIFQDITERTRMRRTLKESEERFRLLFSEIPEAVFVFDPESYKILDVNRVAERRYGYSREEFLNMTVLDIRPEGEVGKVRDLLEGLSSGTVGVRKGFHHKKRNGEVFPVTIYGGIREIGGRRVIIAIAVDDSERVLAEQALRESEERYKALSDQSPIVICLVQDERFVYVNPKAAELVGYDRDEIVGMEATEVVHPDDRAMVRERMIRRLAGEDVESRYEVRVVTKSGEVKWLEIAAVPVTLGGRRATMAHGIDITERKRAESAKHSAETRYREIYENATDIIYTHDLDFNLTAINPAGEKTLGWPRVEAIGRSLRTVVHPDSWATVSRALEEKLLHPNRSTGPYEIQIYDARGELHWLEVTSRLVVGETGPVAVTGIARDITDRKRLEEQLRQAQKMEALGKLAGGVAHDFNNLLTGILGYTRRLIEQNSADPKIAEDLAQIEKAAERAAALTRQLLAFSRQQPLASVHLDLNGLIRDFIDLISRTVGEHIVVETELAPDLPPIFADPAQIEQVLLNLAVNARDAMPHGGRLRIRTDLVEFDTQFVATHPWARRGRFVMLEVSDTGVGMSKRTLERAFEPFFTTKPPEKGTGLGLAIVYGIVKQHEGLLHLESEVDRGTTFHLYFPAARRARIETKQPEPEEAAGGNERILLAEDEAVVRDLATEILTEAGYAVVAVEDGEEALEVLRGRSDRFDLVILDMIMPRKGGADVLKEIRSINPEVKVILTSGYAPESIEINLGETEQVTFLAKPFTPTALLRKVREVIGEKVPEGEG